MNRQETVPQYGYCYCGCGIQTNLAPYNYAKRGWVAGEPLRYIKGHIKHLQYVVNDETGCWDWAKAVSDTGYGVAWSPEDKKLYPAHRYIYRKFKGPIPDGMDLDHLCRNRKCVNPDHLEPVTRSENARRGINPKLNVEKVRVMKKMRKDGARIVDIAAKFGANENTVAGALHGRNWKDVA